MAEEKQELLGNSGGGKRGPDWSRFGLNKGDEVESNSRQDDQHNSNANELYRQDVDEKSKPWYKTNFLVTQPVLFGTWDGVFTSCMINIFGVLIFLRTGWMVGNAGLGLSVLMIFWTISVALIVVLSGIGVCERCRVESGGVYFLLSHVLGSKIGASVGILYCCGQAVACSLYTVGFGESIKDLLHQTNEWVAKGIAVALVFVLLAINLAGVKWVIRLQLVLLMMLFVAVLDFLLGSFIRTDVAHNVTGYSVQNLAANFKPEFLLGQTFFTVFGVFFPTATGVMAGVNMSGDLRNPRLNIPIGTLAAVGVSGSLYLAFALVLGSTCTREALQSDYMIAAKVSGTQLFFLTGLYISSFTSCTGSLYSVPRILQSIAQDNVVVGFHWLAKGVAWLGPLLLTGLYVSSLSAALGGITGTPRVLHAIAVSTRLPLMGPLTISWGPNKVPIFSLIFITLVTLIFVLVGNVNELGPIVTMPYLLTYACIDYAYFALAMSFDENERRARRLENGLKTTYKAIHTDAEAFAPTHGAAVSSGDLDNGDLDSLFPERLDHKGGVSSKRGAAENAGKAKEQSTQRLIERDADEEKAAASYNSSVDQSITKQPRSCYSTFCNRWLSLFGCCLSLFTAFSIKWSYALAALFVIMALYIYIGQTKPGVFPGIAQFNFIHWLKRCVQSICRRGPPPQEEIVVAPRAPTAAVQAAQLTEDNEDYASRDKYHHSQIIHKKDVIPDDM